MHGKTAVNEPVDEKKIKKEEEEQKGKAISPPP
jgi:hypothetical protein